jgi:adenylate cyclase
VASPNQPARRIAAILNADVVGYSKLMASDEAETLHALHAHRARLRSEIELHGGRVVDAIGDNLLAEFPSAVNAVSCAVAAQYALRDLDTAVPERSRASANAR